MLVVPLLTGGHMFCVVTQTNYTNQLDWNKCLETVVLLLGLTLQFNIQLVRQWISGAAGVSYN